MVSHSAQPLDFMPPTAKDFRSDTVTRPTPAMRAAMAAAAVGDDVWGEDPTVIELQDRLAELLGKEAALFVPSGTMSNLVGVRLHCRPGEAMICEAQSHVYYYEQAGYAQVNGLAARPLEGQNGVLRLEQLEALPDTTIRTSRGPACSAWRIRTIAAAAGSSPTITWKRSAAGRGGGACARTSTGHAFGMPRWPRAFRRPVVAALRYGERVLQQRTRCAGGVGAGRPSRPDPRGPAPPQAVRGRHAAGWHPGRGGPLCPRSSRRSPGRGPRQRGTVGGRPASNPRRAAGTGDHRHELGLLSISNQADLRRRSWSSGFAAAASSWARAGRTRSAQSRILTLRRKTCKKRWKRLLRRSSRESNRTSPHSPDSDRFLSG